LTLQHSWGALKEEAKKREERIQIQVARLLMRGEAISHDELAYRRGFLDGMKFLLNRPDHSVAELERATKVRKEVE